MVGRAGSLPLRDGPVLKGWPPRIIGGEIPQPVRDAVSCTGFTIDAHMDKLALGSKHTVTHEPVTCTKRRVSNG
jgi:hypothetical protein